MSDTKHDRLPKFARKEVRQVAEQIVAMGAEFDCWDSTGHPVFKAGNEYITLPMTPKGSAWRPVTIRKVQKALGIKPEKSTRVTYRGFGTGFRMPVENQRSEHVDGLYSDHADISAELKFIRAKSDRKSIDRARALVHRLRRVESELRRLYQAEPADGWFFREDDLGVAL